MKQGAVQLCCIVLATAIASAGCSPQNVFGAHRFVKKAHSDHRRSRYVTPPSSSSSRGGGAFSVVQSLRGGAGPLDPVATTRVVTTLQGWNHLLVLLAASKTLEAYGLHAKDPIVPLLFRRSSIAYGAVTAMAFLTILKGVPTHTAVAYASSLPWALEILRSFLNEEGKTMGMKDPGQATVGLMSLAVTVACLRGNAQQAELALKVWSIFAGLSGATILVANDKSRDLWGIGGSAEAIFSSRVIGYALTSMGVMVGAMVWGNVSPQKAFGYATVVCLANLIDNNFITKEVPKLGLQATPQYIWMAINVAIIVTLAF